MRHQGTDITGYGRRFARIIHPPKLLPVLLFLLVFCFYRSVYAEPAALPDGRMSALAGGASGTRMNSSAGEASGTRMTGYAGEVSPWDYPSFLEHVEEQGGSLREELRNSAWNEVPADQASGPGFTWILTVSSPAGILPGTYYYELPERMHPELLGSGGEIANAVDTIGEWYTEADEDGIPVLILSFTPNAASYQDFTGNITCSVWFEYADDEWEEPCEESITKSGYFDSTDGCFHFTIEAEIPAYDGIEHREWRVYDYSIVSGGTWLYPRMGEMDITLEMGDSEIEINSIEEADETTQIAFVPYVERVEGKEYYGVYLVNRCKCSAHSGCIWMEEGTMCESLWELEDSVDIDPFDYEGWCTCWAFPKNSCLIVRYVDVRGCEWVREYGGGTYRNNADLNELETSVNLTIPTFLTKTVTPSSGSFTSSNDFLGTYTIEVNPEQFDLSQIDADGDGVPDHRLVLTDRLDHLAYIPGSLEVVRVGRNAGQIGSVQGTGESESAEVLTAGRDYDLTATSDSTNLTGQMEIVLYEPGAWTYRLTYRAQALAAKSVGVTKSGYAENTAVLHIFGGIEKSVRKRYVYASGWDFARRELVIVKTDRDNGKLLLPGAVYGLYSRLDERIAVETTDENGELHFRTNAAAGVILLDGEPYYVRELAAPAGYLLDESVHPVSWTGDSVIRLTLTDEPEETDEAYELPLTGGRGSGLWRLAGLAVMMTAAALQNIKRKRY